MSQSFDLDDVAGVSLDAELWDDFVNKSPQGSLYTLHGYASTVAPNWRALLFRQNGKWIATLPFLPQKKWGVRYIAQPLMCQQWGVLFAPFEGNRYYDQSSREKKILYQLADFLTQYHYSVQHFSTAFTYPQPLMWRGFRASPRYTYLLDLTPAEDELRSGIDTRLRQKIKRAERQDVFTFERAATSAPLLKLIERNERAQRHNYFNPKLRQTLSHIADYLLVSKAGEISTLRTSEGIAAAILIADFRDRRICLSAMFDPQQTRTQALWVLYWHSIAEAKKRGLRFFDFEGGMIESVESGFRKFGARPVPYLRLSHNRLPPPLRWMLA